MNARLVSFWDRCAELALLLLAFALPLAFDLNAYDSAALKDALLAGGAAAVLAFVLLRWLESGRVEAGRGRVAAAWAGFALLSWTVLSYLLFSPHRPALMETAVRASGLVLFLGLLLGPASTGFAAALTDALLAAGLLAGSYGLLQRLGADPLIWKGAFGSRAFSTLAEPKHLGLFLGALFPLALARSLQASRPAAKLLAWGSAALCLLGPAASGSPEGLLCLLASSALFALGGLALPVGARLRRRALLALASLPAALILALRGGALSDEVLRLAAQARAAAPGAQQLFRDHFWFGSGTGAFSSAFIPYRGEALARLEGPGLWLRPPASTEALRIACENGALGLALWGLLPALVLALALRALRRAPESASPASAALLLGQGAALGGLLLCAVAAAELSSPAVLALFWLLAGSLAGLAAEESSTQVRVLPLPAPPALRRSLGLPILACLLAALFGLASQLRSGRALNRGVYYARQGLPQEALAGYGGVGSWHPSAAWARYGAGRIMEKAGGRSSLEAALKSYGQALELSPRQPAVLLRRAGVNYALARWEPSAEDLRETLRIDPFNAEACLQLADLDAILHRPDEARAALLRLARARPDDPQTWQALARGYREAGRYRAARRMQNRASRVSDVARREP